MTILEDVLQPYDQSTQEDLDLASAAGDARAMEYVRTHADCTPMLEAFQQ